MLLILRAVILLFIFSTTLCQKSDCSSKERCDECIQELDCVWCINPNGTHLEGNSVHCYYKLDITHEFCNISDMISPESNLNILSSRPLGSKQNDPIQLTPQKVKLTLRRGENFELDFQYAQAENYPLDLYYVMDLSASMDDHKDKLGKLGLELAETMRNITNDFRLGFGSVVDKIAFPFVDTNPKSLKEPCRLNKVDRVVICAPPYSFRNHLKLSSNYTKFSQEVNSAQISGNIDAPEGGLDGLMQAIVCSKEIGWRPQARHLLVFSSDALLHIAGDGKLGGVVIPNDAKCHMENNYYTEYGTYDYPSVSQINYVAKENNINIIFAIVRKLTTVVESYKELSKSIENSNMGVLEGNSENVINLVLDNYNKIVNTVSLSTNSTSDVNIEFSSNCEFPTENGCSNVHVGQVVNFTAKIRPLTCSHNGSNSKMISIKPNGLNDSIIVELDVICNCNCSDTAKNQENSKECSGAGIMQCGICRCNSGRFGEKCECDKLLGDTGNTTNCQATPDSEICSSLGMCKCGKCECNKRTNPKEKVYGKFCQCNNFSCKREKGVICSGRGTCDCGTCICDTGWTGDSCQCLHTNISCIDPVNGLICSERGKCVCGKCECSVEEEMYFGDYCQECTTCSTRCGELAKCAQCQAYHSGEYNKNDCQLKCTAFKTDVLEEWSEDDGRKKCSVLDNEGCTILFDYTYDANNDLLVRAYKEKLCPFRLNLTAWIFIVIGTILLAGIIMLVIWKALTTIHDHKEFAKFEDERRGAKWHQEENPLYIPSITSFKNPVYKRSVSGGSC